MIVRGREKKSSILTISDWYEKDRFWILKLYYSRLTESFSNVSGPCLVAFGVQTANHFLPLFFFIEKKLTENAKKKKTTKRQEMLVIVIGSIELECIIELKYSDPLCKIRRLPAAFLTFSKILIHISFLDDIF